jgi:hypothetical protein
VGAGFEPIIDWKPGCRVGSIVVERIDGTARSAVWQVFVPENEIAPRIRYGSRGQATPLIAGGTYRVILSTVIGGDALAEVGIQTFLR